MKSHSFLMRFTIVLIAVFGFMTLANADAATATTKSSKSSLPTKKNVHVLFTQTAASATITPLKEKNWYTLTLNDVNPDVLWFSDRPNRLSGDIAMTDFLKGWKKPTNNDNFVKDHPNADLIGASGNNKVRAVFMLTKPNYDANQKTLTYTALHLAGSGNFDSSMTSVSNAVLFIDSSKCFGGSANPFCH